MKRSIAALFIAVGIAVAAPALPFADHCAALASADKDAVVFNVSNHKYHHPTCIWACRCTVHCVNITRGEAHQRGGVPCKICNGGEQ